MSDEITATRWVLYEASEPRVPRINPELALELKNLFDSLIFTQMAFLLKTSQNVFDGRYWIYKTASELQAESFSFLERTTITKSLQQLCEHHHLLDRRNDLNKRKGDRTYWYALNVEYISRLKSVVLLPQEQTIVIKSQPIVTKSPALPDMTTDIKEKDSCSPVGETGVKTKKEAIAPRERNLLFDAVAVHVFGITDLALINGDGAQIGIITAWLDGKLERIKQGRTTKIIGKLPRAASPEHVEMFARAYAKEHKGAALPRDIEKFSNHWRAWASKASRPALRPAARFEDTPPADPEEYMR